MQDFNYLGRTLIILGLIIIGIGIIVMFLNKIPFIGKLPGDIYIEKKNFKFYFPLASSIVVSIILSIIFRLFSKK
ncbi:MAG: DUF2905 domain-containing protein [bacterium]